MQNPVTDQVRAFESTHFTHVCKYMGIDKMYSNQYHHSTHGLVERTNMTLEILRTLVEDYTSVWDKHLEKAIFEFKLTADLSLSDPTNISAENKYHRFIPKFRGTLKSSFKNVKITCRNQQAR
ncbi:hypothetical protein RF11_06107 [Thelohanellus kitauei]|uniref:Integrase catalytic domain-containing protein n=1 Tax=Thelohanellus kitauei TaxID=669202 RepID=A0A0C2IWN9_THEKT|nr:hypothetical protein RF11_06107 [Thelohanellus kitauei]